MELTFKKGDYDQHMSMVNASKELLNESIALRNIKASVDQKITEYNSNQFQNKNLGLFLILAIPLTLVVLLSIFSFGFSWRIIAGIGMIGFFIVYYIITRDNDVELSMPSPGLHDDDPRPLKFLDMKVDYLIGHNELKKTRYGLLRTFYFIFFPFLCYFLYEMVFGYTPFQSILTGLIAAIVLSTTAWFFFFRGDFEAFDENDIQLKGFKKVILQHHDSVIDAE